MLALICAKILHHSFIPTIYENSIFFTYLVQTKTLKLVYLFDLSNWKNKSSFQILSLGNVLIKVYYSTILAKESSACLWTKWLWVRISLLWLRLQIWRPLWARSCLTFRQTIECRFTLNIVRDMIITYSQSALFRKWKMSSFIKTTACNHTIFT